ncbi:hypothetical protein OG470_21860 [Micromonospora sp. NBC_00389]|uniref:hypothetical protein n=1 Tax=Micromonospora sp. NBC_00389 TaxID=2903586 RepID=UPI002E1CB860
MSMPTDPTGSGVPPAAKQHLAGPARSRSDNFAGAEEVTEQDALLNAFAMRSEFQTVGQAPTLSRRSAEMYIDQAASSMAVDDG